MFRKQNGGFRKLIEESINERQKPLIFKSLTKQISRYGKKINGENINETEFFKRWISIFAVNCMKLVNKCFFMCFDVFKCCLLCSQPLKISETVN